MYRNSDGVVFCIHFGNKLGICYNCCQAMQTLTAQYPTLYTRKFRVFFSDFQPSTSQNGLITLFTLPAANQIVHCAIRCHTAFVGGSFTQIQFRVCQQGQVPPVGNATAVFAQLNVVNGVLDRYGTSVWIQNRTQINPSISQLIMCNFSTPTVIQGQLYVVGTGNLNSLSDGAIDVWVTSMRMS